MKKLFVVQLLLAFSLTGFSASADAPGYQGSLVETLTLQHSVKPEGDLPPIAERIPAEPLIVV